MLRLEAYLFCGVLRRVVCPPRLIFVVGVVIARWDIKGAPANDAIHKRGRHDEDFWQRLILGGG